MDIYIAIKFVKALKNTHIKELYLGPDNQIQTSLVILYME